jgi:beta-N-acetylhexosaminidase
MQVEATLARMTLPQKVGQLMMFGFGGTTIDGAAAVIQQYQPGAIILYQNTVNPVQTSLLTAKLQAMAHVTGAGIPLFIAIDQEGGEVQRLRNGITYFPSKLVLGATHDPDLARLEGDIEGRELRALGINMNLSPVLDVDDNPNNPIIDLYERSLGSDPQVVAAMGVAYVDALQAQKVVAVAKHFPGHGSTSQDSHLTLPVLDHDLARLHRVELVPFEKVVPEVGGMMSAHIIFSAIDQHSPASLSSLFLKGILRDELHYNGLIMTDDTGGMAAITANFGPGDAAVQAINAGNDLVMVVGNATRERESFDAVVRAVKSGQISQTRVDESVRRILRIKAKYGLLESPGAGANDLEAGPDSRGAMAVQKIAENSVTVVQNNAVQIPVREGDAHRVLVISANTLPAVGTGTLLGKDIRQRRPNTNELVFSMNADNQAIYDSAMRQVSQVDMVVIGTYLSGPWQRQLVQDLFQRGAKPIVIGFGRPYEVADFPVEITYLAAYNSRSEMVDAAVKVLFGEIEARGRLPVAIGNTYPAGYSVATTP